MNLSKLLFRRSGVIISVVACVVAVLNIPAAGAQVVQPLNDCADPHWANSLRCQLYPNQVPQPNLTTAPTNPGQIKPFTRVFLDQNLSVRSFDGTFPVMYVDRAVCTIPAGCPDGARFREETHSNNWVISVTGGGSCHVDDTTTPGVYDDPTTCLRNFANPNERDEMSTATDPPMKSLGGINRPNAVDNPMFAMFNRVRVEKSSFDRFLGRIAYDNPLGGYFTYTVGGQTYTFDLYQQGFLFLQEAIQMLNPGLTYTTWEPAPFGKVRALKETLPPLAQAERVVFVGHSGGAHGLHHNIDHLAALLPSSDVRAVFDANFVEGAENEAFFGFDPTGAPIGGDAYTGDWQGITIGDGGVPFAYDGEFAAKNGGVSDQMRSWGTRADESCLTSHVPAEQWMCSDRTHVLLNHISTPYLFREDFLDPNPEHTANLTGHTVQWGRPDNFPYCPTAAPCLPRFSVAQHHDRLREQARRLIGESGFSSELATGADASLPVGPFPTVYAWMPACGSHNGTYDDDQFFGSGIDYAGSVVSLREWVQQFVQAPRVAPPEWRIHGYQDPVGNTMLTAPCP